MPVIVRVPVVRELQRLDLATGQRTTLVNGTAGHALDLLSTLEGPLGQAEEPIFADRIGEEVRI